MLTRSAGRWRRHAANASPQAGPTAGDSTNGQAAACATAGWARSGLDSGMPETFWYSVKRRVLGPPLVNDQLRVERLSKPLALGVLSCDGISSANYGSELI